MTTSISMPKAQLFVPSSKGSSLPTSVFVTIPASLEWEIKRKLTSVLARLEKGLFCTFSCKEELTNLAQLLGQGLPDQDFRVMLYGGELMALYRFLGEQELWLDIWWPGADRTVAHQFLRQLKSTSYRVDIHASRPITVKG